MSNQMITSELFAELPHQQQDLCAIDTDFELAGSNCVSRLVSLPKTITTPLTGSTDNSIGTTAQVLGRLSAPTVPGVGALS
ncbi:hypothetical protein [Calothrix sp. PCC 7507]|uniref:hypothetical protein n=1 Tax=Calothrix sp. PCC 7507 TaxID=99598 RepID=UPI00029ED3E8|nr:hypothetical protein [Calothrix sp. PCC 7507]AFY32589.1 hypothetical protein Cal7507_2147 [Calothrix sp. PCC 7507]